MTEPILKYEFTGTQAKFISQALNSVDYRGAQSAQLLLTCLQVLQNPLQDIPDEQEEDEKETT